RGWVSQHEPDTDVRVSIKALRIFQQSVYQAMLGVVTTYRNCGYQFSDSVLEYWFKSKLWGFSSEVFDSGSF
ncbi:hypothetical protein BGX21_005540, partial [Mortierella sp. AD011]